MANIGPLEIAVVLVIVLVVFGPRRLPELGKSMGKGIREFKGSLSTEDKDEIPADISSELAESPSSSYPSGSSPKSCP